ncbi:putative F-box protein At1g47790 [Bidens hawaiensis]|uniref:putative F-box protein At1g47790 n=1 Tax=Bidens hawaiensis TaxID=980011 RepID=UPI00404ACB71
MSNNVLPSEIFLKLLPVKSLIRFRSVSKTWKSLIDSRDFVIKHHTHHSQSRQQLLVAYENQVPVSDDDDDWDYEQKYVSVVDDNAFPKHNVVLTPPLLVRMLTRPRLIATSHGLMCLFNRTRWGDEAVFLWNPSIRKIVATDLGHLK